MRMKRIEKRISLSPGDTHLSRIYLLTAEGVVVGTMEMRNRYTIPRLKKVTSS
jgi:hypothetical protein